MAFRGGAWAPVGGFAGVSFGAVQSTSLALEASGTPWLAYSDTLNGDRAVVKQLGWGPPRWVGGLGGRREEACLE